MIRIKKILNTSVVLVENDVHQEFIMLGKGIGFGQKAGNVIEEHQADQLFMPIETIKAREFINLLDSIDPVYIDLTQEIVNHAEQKLGTKLNPGVFFTLMDHLSFAVERYKKNINLKNRVYWEIKSYYTEEFKVGEFALKRVNETFNINLPKEEAANIAFHVINAHGQEHHSRDGMQQAKMIGSIVNLVRYTLNINMNTESIHYTRFITHVKFFVERYFADEMLDDKDDVLFEQIASLYPEAMNGAFKIKEYINQVYKKSISNDELTYLAVHIHRLLSYDQLSD